MKNVTTISDLISKVYELIKESHPSFGTVAQAVKAATEQMQFFSKSMIGIRSQMIVVEDNMTAVLPEDCAGVIKVSSVRGKRLIMLDRNTVIPTQESYALRQGGSGGCENCTCCEEDPTSEETDVTSELPKAACLAVTFHNFGNCNMCGIRVKNYGTFQEEGNRLFLSSVRPESHIMVEYKVLKDASSFQMIPSEAFDAIYYKALSYLERDNLSHETRFRSYKKQFDLLKVRETYNMDEVIRILRG